MDKAASVGVYAAERRARRSRTAADYGFCHQENSMPTIRVDLFEGRSPEQKRNLVKALTQACVDTLGSKPQSVDILLFDIKPSDWATGGVLWSDQPKS
ncbi:MAG: 4-oxalocrotonate tautomerase [Burkholderiales bacterium]